MDNRAIGIFDSGLGGLTALSALRRLLPGEDLIYFADSARMPYGGRAAGQLRKMARQDLDFVASFSVKAIIAACGTVSSTAPDLLESYRLPVFGVVKPAVRAMGQLPGKGPLAVIATEASIRAGVFQRELALRCPGREIIGLPCPDFVPLIESGHTDAGDPLLRRAVEAVLAPLSSAGISALLLGCTHYGIIDRAIKEQLGAQVPLVSASECAAAELRDYIVSAGIEGGGGRVRYFTSGSPAAFRQAASALLEGQAVTAEQAPLMEAEGSNI